MKKIPDSTLNGSLPPGSQIGQQKLHPEEQMRPIDMQTWPRRKHFEIYNAFDYPHFNLCANVDVTHFHPLVKQRQFSLTIAIVYLLAKGANAFPEFRYRIHGRQVVEYKVIHPSTTILTKGDLFSFCTIPFADNFEIFAKQAAETMEIAKRSPSLDDEGRDDLLFMTGIPWVSFTSVVHPINMHPTDSVPRLSWGKFFSEGDRMKMPLSVQVHHALMDGVHVGRYFAQIQAELDHPEFL